MDDAVVGAVAGRRLLARLSRAPPWAVLAGAGGGILAALLVDWSTGAELSLLVFYVPFVAVVALRGTWPWTITAVTLVSAGTAAAQLSGPHANPVGVVLWVVAARWVFLFMVAWTLMQLRDSLAREQQLARTDQLTGAANRLAFHEAAGRELARARRNGTGLVAAFLDLDGLKAINDRHGHEAGDRALRCLAEVAHSTLRTTDVFARIGGDEFVAVLPDTDLAGARQVCERVVAELHRRNERITVSVGIAAWSADGLPASVDELLAAADRLMYLAKPQGGGRVTISQMT